MLSTPIRNKGSKSYKTVILNQSWKRTFIQNEKRDQPREIKLLKVRHTSRPKYFLPWHPDVHVEAGVFLTSVASFCDLVMSTLAVFVMNHRQTKFCFFVHLFIYVLLHRFHMHNLETLSPPCPLTCLRILAVAKHEYVRSVTLAGWTLDSCNRSGGRGAQIWLLVHVHAIQRRHILARRHRACGLTIAERIALGV